MHYAQAGRTALLVALEARNTVTILQKSVPETHVKVVIGVACRRQLCALQKFKVRALSIVAIEHVICREKVADQAGPVTKGPQGEQPRACGRTELVARLIEAQASDLRRVVLSLFEAKLSNGVRDVKMPQIQLPLLVRGNIKRQR